MASPSPSAAEGTEELQRGYRKKTPFLLKLPLAWESPGELADSEGLGWGLRLCISNDLLGGAHAAGPWATLGGR